MTELLSPAGSWESLVAAVQNGADAVYMGFGDFNARRNAKNFSAEEFAAALDYCHLRGVKVYLTLNTLLTDRELPAAAEQVAFACTHGVDAILVQDWGVLQMLQQTLPDQPIHASTQMSLHTLGGANTAASLGMERVVLARELSESDIAEICAGCSAEIETFIHGALCMCYSGQCAMSALIGGRSGNRGTCAQPCRLPYGESKADSYPLSLKDACLAPYVQQMQRMGVACLKLEGRMKRPEYVAVITGIYSRLLKEQRLPSRRELQQLELAFSRSGFTDAYYRGKKGTEMFGVRPQNPPDPTELFAEVRTSYEKENLRLIPVSFRGSFRLGEPATLEAWDEDGHRICVQGACAEAARNRAVTAEEIVQRLGKTGGTAFSCASCEVTVDEGISLSASALNALRRDALAELTALRCAPPVRRVLPFVPAPTVANPTEAPALTCSIARAEQLTEELVDCAPDWIYIPLELLPKLDLTPYLGRTQFCAVLPRIYRTRDEAPLRQQLETAVAQGISAVTIGNLGHFPLVEGLGLELRGDFSLNVFNSLAIDFLRKQGLASVTLSFELRHQQIRDLQKSLPCEAIVYGRLPLMLTENCLIHNQEGQCGCQTAHRLTDRTGAQFPLLPAYGCRTEVQNAHTLFLADKPQWKQVGLRWGRLRFTTESPAECVAVLRRYQGLGDFLPDAPTGGLFYRGVE